MFHILLFQYIAFIYDCFMITWLQGIGYYLFLVYHLVLFYGRLSLNFAFNFVYKLKQALNFISSNSIFY